MAQQMQMTLGANVARLRRANRLTQHGLAAACQVNRSTIHAIERGRGNPELSTIAKLAAALRVPSIELLQIPSDEKKDLGAEYLARGRSKWAEHWDPGEMFDLTQALFNVNFITNEDINELNLKNAPSNTFENFDLDIMIGLNIPFISAPSEAMYYLISKDTRHFRAQCADIAASSERLLKALGYPLRRLEDTASGRFDCDHRMSPTLRQFAFWMRDAVSAQHVEPTSALLREWIEACMGKSKHTHIYLDMMNMPRALNAMRAGGKLLPKIPRKSIGKIHPVNAIQKALFQNITRTYYVFFKVRPPTTDAHRAPLGHGTIWTKRLIRIGTKRLVNYCDGLLPAGTHKSPWLGYLKEGLLEADQLSPATVARRLSTAWAEFESTGRGDPSVSPYPAYSILFR